MKNVAPGSSKYIVQGSADSDLPNAFPTGASTYPIDVATSTLAIGLRVANTFVSVTGNTAIQGSSTGNSTTSGNSIGIVGAASGAITGKSNFGVLGQAISTSAGANYGVYGQATGASSGQNVGVVGSVSGSSSGNIAGQFNTGTGSNDFAITTSGCAIVNGSRDVVQLIVKANATQTTNIQEWQKSDGTVVARVSAAGSVASIQGALSSASPAFSSSATWNTGVSSCNHWLASITDNTAVQNWLQVMQVNGANKWLIDKNGFVNAGNADAAFISTGVIAQARLGSGTPSNIKYLRGDGQWIVKWNIQVKNSNVAIGAQENLLWCDATGGNISLTLPDAASNNGIELMFIRGDASANTITLNRAGSDLFFPSGTTSITIPVNAGKFVRLLALSIYWVNIGSN